MKKDLLAYLLAIVVPALLFTAGGLHLLRLEYRHAVADEESAYRNRAAAAAFRERDLVDLCWTLDEPVRDRGDPRHLLAPRSRLNQETRYRKVVERGLTLAESEQGASFTAGHKTIEISRLSDYFRDARGAFIWREGKGVVWQTGLTPDRLAELTPDRKWIPTGHSRSGRGGEYGWFETGTAANRITVLWAGSYRRKTVFGLTADLRSDTSDRFALFGLAGGTFAAFLCFSLVAGGAALMRSLMKARAEALLKTTFVSNVSHELKTPLTSILSYAEMLSEGRFRTEEKRARACAVITEESRRMERMVTELLDFSRLERRRKIYNAVCFDLNEVVRGTVDRMSELFVANGVTVTAGEACPVCADADAVKEILENLLGNAAKYAAAVGSVEVAVSGAVGEPRRVRVMDRGPGLTRAEMNRVFEPFWRADTAVTKESGGYGIGLSIARRLARGMGGEVTVEARPGGGCVFTLTLPDPEEEKHKRCDHG